MGGSTTNFIIHSGNVIKYSGYLGVGSNNVTKDISKVLQTQPQFADNIKINFVSLSAKYEGHDMPEMPMMGDEEFDITL